MSRAAVRRVGGALLGLGVSAPASAVNMTFCGYYAVDYEDVNADISQLGDDYFLTDANVQAIGAQLTLEDNVTHSVTALFLDEDTGCSSTVALDGSHTYKVTLWAYASINGNTVRVRNCDGDTNDLDGIECSSPLTTYSHLDALYMTPTAGQRTITTGVAPAWNIAAAAGFAMHRRPACLDGETFIFYTEPCPRVASVSCQGTDISNVYVGNYLYIEASAWDSKYVVAHELGHAVAEASNGWAAVNADGSALNSAPCDGGIVEKEYASNAANEGIAWYYAAVVFNNPDEADCEIRKGRDYDNVNNIVAGDNEKTPSCEGDPLWNTGSHFETWPDEDYLAGMCSGTLTDRGTAMDYMRALWDADNDAFTTCDIFAMWDAADPDDWDSDGGGGANDPKERLEAGAQAIGLLSEWTAVSGPNGVR